MRKVIGLALKMDRNVKIIDSKFLTELSRTVHSRRDGKSEAQRCDEAGV